MLAIKQVLLQNMLSILLASVDSELVRRIVDSALDAVEDAVSKSETKVDDAVVVPLVKTIRLALSIPNEDDTPKKA